MTIYIVPHFHYDVAYLRTFEEYLPLCFDNLREAVRIMDAEPEYRFLSEQPILLEEFRRRCPEDFAGLRACAARGQVEIACGMWSMPDMNFPSGESLIRQALVGKAWARAHLGLDVPTCWIADCWGHPATLPQILRHCGYRHYAFSRGMRRECQALDFRWRGLDGSEVLVHWMPLGYGPLMFPTTAHIENRLEQDMTFADEGRLTGLVERFGPWRRGENVLLGNGGDFVRPQAGAPELVRRWRARGHDARFASTSEYFAAVAQEDLPVLEGEFNPLLTGTYGSRIAIKQENRRLECALLALERALALSPAPSPTGLQAAASAWKTALKNQFHDISSGTLIDAANAQVMEEYADAKVWAGLALLDAVATLAGGPGEGGVVVFNPSGFPRREVVALPVRAAAVIGPDGPLACQPATEGTLVEVDLAPLEVQVVVAPPTPRTRGAEEVGDKAPPTPRTRGEQAEVAPFVIENGALRVTVAADGTLSSVVDVRTGRECVDPGRPYWGDLVYRNDNGDLWLLDRGPLDGGGLESRLAEERVWDPYARSEDPLVNAGPICQHGSRRQVRLLEAGPLRWTVQVKGALGFWRNRVEFETQITLYRGSRRIGFETSIVPSGRHYRLHACFPTGIRGAHRQEVAFGFQERDDRLFAAQNWSDLSDGDGGVCLLNRGLPGNGAHDGVLSLLLFRSAAMEYKGESVGAFYEGVPHRFHYAVLPWAAGDAYLPYREGEALNLPLAMAPCAGPARRLASGLELAPENVHLSALYPSGKQRILRVYEAAGRACEAVIRLPEGVAACCESDGLETPGAPVPIQDGCLRVPLRAFEIRTFLLGR